MQLKQEQHCSSARNGEESRTSRPFLEMDVVSEQERTDRNNVLLWE